MEVLGPWLAATIEGELSEALRHWEGGTNKAQSADKSQGFSYDDGSNLRIRSAEKGPVVQITKFLTFKDPIQVTLSDSVIRVNASISNQASQRYLKENKRPLTQGTLGMLIQLHGFEIVATHLGPRDKRLTLYVKDFKSLDTGESGNFGVAPQAIESRERTKELLNKLADLRKHGTNVHSAESAVESPMNSQPSTQISEATNDQDSQAGFATQVPRSVAAIVSKSKPQGSNTKVNISSTFSADSANLPAHPIKVKHSNVPESTLNTLQRKAAPERPSVNHRKALLGLLRSHNRASAGENEKQASEIKDSISHDAKDGRIATAAQKRKRLSPETSQRKKLSNEHSLQDLNFDQENLAANNTLENKPSSPVGATEASIDALPGQPASTLTLKSTNSHSNASREPPIHSHSEDSSSALAQNHMRNGISRRDVSIPKDQEALLSRPDSWLPAEPGQREPAANVPISLLKRQNQKAAFRAQGPMKSGKKGKRAVSPSTAVDQSVDSESDVPLSSGQWPASPELEQLPPDSSLASAEHSDHSAHRTLNTSHSAPSARRPSNASLSRLSLPSEPPSPLPARRSSRESGSCGMAFPSAVSPSVTSTSAGEEVHGFACQVPSCDKSFKESSGLESHVDRHHRSPELLENFMCPSKDCTKSYTTPGDLKHHVEHQHDGDSVRASHSGSATPTTPGPSTPITPALQSWSERDEVSAQKISNVAANNGLDDVEVLASMPLVLDRRSESLGDNELPKRHSSMESELGGNRLSNMPSALIEPATANPDGTYVAHETPSSPVPASPISESDLEMTVPHALNEATDSPTNSAPTHNFPCTASQPEAPFTQVKRTPYGNSRPQNETSSASMIISLPLKSSLYPLVNGNMKHDTDFVSASIISGPDTSAETHHHIRSPDAMEDQNILKVAARPAGEVNSHEGATSRVEKPEQLVAENQQEMSKVDSVANIPDNASPVETGSRRQSLGLDQPAMLQASSIQRLKSPEKLSTPESNPRERLPLLSTSDDAIQFAREVKRKATDASFLLPGVTKRQKRFKVPSAFTFTERSDVRRDPLEGARQYRQEFLASRRSSETSTPTASPTISVSASPVPTAENLRDPSERARHLCQEFLTSRKSSETSTPATSPRMHLTALNRTIEVRDGDMGKDVEQFILQDQSVGTGLDLQNSAELKDISVVPQSQEANLDAAALPNGTASIEMDSDDAKSGAQDGTLHNHEADNSVLDAQNADVERPNAKPSSVGKASLGISSNVETQRARSVELDASIPSPDHEETKEELTNTEDEADQTVNTEAGLNVTNRDQFEDRKEDNRPEDLKFAHNYAPTRIVDVAEQEIDLSTPRAILDHVPEHENAAPEYMQGKSPIEDDITIELPIQTALEPSNQQALVAEEAEIQMPDEATVETMSDQQLVGSDLNTPMVDVQVPQDLSSQKIFGDSGEPIGQSIPLPPVTSALVSDSKLSNQHRLSPTAFNPTLLASNPISSSKIQSIEKTQRPIKPTQQAPPFVAQSLFERFRETYPMYPGDSKHFGAICRKISQLVRMNRMEHQSLWDDFIIRHKVDYLRYLRQCAEEAEDAVSYEVFYRTRVEGPQYQEGIISPQNLDEALSLIGQQPSPKPIHAEPIGDHKPRVKQVGHESPSKLSPIVVEMDIKSSSANNRESSDPGGTQSASRHKPATSYENDRRLSDSRVVIDLTIDDPPDNPPKRLRDREIGPLSSMLHPVKGVSIESPSSKRSQDKASSFSQVPSTSPVIQGSHACPSPQTIRPPLVPATGSTKNATKSLRRSLPWEDPNRSILQSSGVGKASDSPKGTLSSGLRNIHPKGVTNTRDDCLQIPAASPPNILKQGRSKLDTYHKLIQANWGVKVQELLESDYLRRQVWSESMVELLAVIASRIDLGEAHIRIKRVIETRLGDSARRGADQVSQERTMLKSDLEVVRDAVTSSMSMTSPFSPPQTNAAVEKQSRGSPIEWWHDNNSPFKSFARAYLSIRHGNGNSFAKASPTESNDREMVASATRGGVEFKKVDITKWKL